MDRDQAYRLALVVEARARLDAREWVARLPRQVSVLARGRADQILEPDRDDPLRTALAREWYVRVFTDEARNQLGLGRPEVEVTPTETEHLAECLRAGVAYRIHGPGGSIVANPDGPEVVPGQANSAERQEDLDNSHGLTENQTRRVLEALADDQDRRRVEDQRIVGAAWDDLTPDQRTAFAEYWHQQHDTRGHGAFPAAAPVRDVASPTGRRRPRRPDGSEGPGPGWSTAAGAPRSRGVRTPRPPGCSVRRLPTSRPRERRTRSPRRPSRRARASRPRSRPPDRSERARSSCPPPTGTRAASAGT